jgi:predicted translin family RNA/ssDNA-binding protein
MGDDMTLPENRKPLLWQDMPFADRPKGHPSTERLEIEKLKERVTELTTDNRRLRDKNQELMEAVAMADWHFRGANMNMKALEEKIGKALWCLGGEKDDDG